MYLTAYQVFVFMYCILDDIWATNNDEHLSIYLSEANPFACDEGSADPIVFNDFVKLFGANQILDDFGYEIIVKYLKQLDSYYGDILVFFFKISKSEYIEKCQKLITLSKEELKKQHI